MRIKKIRIKNYKSIIDSGDCYLESDLTIFAGKNESGKTSILEALEDFNSNKNISENAKPIGKKNNLPEIAITIILSPSDLDAYYKIIEVDRKVSSEQEIYIAKSFPNKYSIDESTAALLSLDFDTDESEKEEIRTKVVTIYNQLFQLHNQFLKKQGWTIFKLDLEDIGGTIIQLNAYSGNFVKVYQRAIPNANMKNNYSKAIQDLKSVLAVYSNIKSTWNKHWDVFLNLLPNFILFISFEDLVPNEVPFDQLDTSEFIRDLKAISDIDISLVKSDDKRDKLQHHKKINIKLNKEYSKFWLQDTSELKIHWDNNVLQFWIEEDSILYKPSERSKGKQWHLSFYTKISARAIREKNNVILIDEPGLYLHATAQKDIYNKIIDLSKKSQILYTTHSPYLINRDELNKVRLVLKNFENTSDGTTIENKIHAKADKETLTPILTAIGLGLSDGIQNINQINNIVIEGPSDYFYLQGFKILINKKSLNFIFGGGAGNMGNVGTILNGWGCKVVYLYDNDQGKKDGSKNLVKTWLVCKELIHTIKDDVGSIEDLFSTKDFYKFVLIEKKEITEPLNSKFIKKEALNKVLLARQFNSQCQKSEVILSKETMTNIIGLFKKLESAF